MIGRWGGVDPLAEASYSQTPYHYANNDPLFYTDPTGMFANPFIESLLDGTIKWISDKAAIPDGWRYFASWHRDIPEIYIGLGERRQESAFNDEVASAKEAYRKSAGNLFMGYPDNLRDRALNNFYEKYYARNEVDPFTKQAILGDGSLVDANWAIDLGGGAIGAGLRAVAVRVSARAFSGMRDDAPGGLKGVLQDGGRGIEAET